MFSFSSSSFFKFSLPPEVKTSSFTPHYTSTSPLHLMQFQHPCLIFSFFTGLSRNNKKNNTSHHNMSEKLHWTVHNSYPLPPVRDYSGLFKDTVIFSPHIIIIMGCSCTQTNTCTFSSLLFCIRSGLILTKRHVLPSPRCLGNRLFRPDTLLRHSEAEIPDQK